MHTGLAPLGFETFLERSGDLFIERFLKVIKTQTFFTCAGYDILLRFVIASIEKQRGTTGLRGHQIIETILREESDWDQFGFIGIARRWPHVAFFGPFLAKFEATDDGKAALKQRIVDSLAFIYNANSREPAVQQRLLHMRSAGLKKNGDNNNNNNSELIEQIVTGRIGKKKAKGKDHHNGYDDDDDYQGSSSSKSNEDGEEDEDVEDLVLLESYSP